jgi:hypothetical protein
MPLQKCSSHTLLEVTSPSEIAALLNINKPAMIRQTVLSSGKKPEVAAREFDQNVAWLNKIARLTLSLSADQADLDLELK